MGCCASAHTTLPLLLFLCRSSQASGQLTLLEAKLALAWFAQTTGNHFCVVLFIFRPHDAAVVFHSLLSFRPFQLAKSTSSRLNSGWCVGCDDYSLLAIKASDRCRIGLFCIAYVRKWRVIKCRRWEVDCKMRKKQTKKQALTHTYIRTHTKNTRTHIPCSTRYLWPCKTREDSSTRDE